MKRFRAVIELNGHSEFHTSVVVHMRKKFGRDAAQSAHGFGYRQYEAVLVTVPPGEVILAMAGRVWENLVNVKEWSWR